MEKYFIEIDNSGTVIKVIIYDVQGTEYAVSLTKQKYFLSLFYTIRKER
jgi:hypothetical protein